MRRPERLDHIALQPHAAGWKRVVIALPRAAADEPVQRDVVRERERGGAALRTFARLGGAPVAKIPAGEARRRRRDLLGVSFAYMQRPP